MAHRSEGVKRILFLLSILSVISWIAFIGVESDGFSTVNPIGWLILVGTSIAAYFAPQLIGKITYWVVDGFRKGKET